MDSQSQFTVDIICKVIDGRISITSATTLLNKSRRTVERYLNRYRKEGIRFVIHGNKGRSPVNKIANSLKEEVQNLIQTKYYDFNLQHLAELLEKNEGISIKRETLRSWAHDIHHVKRAKRRRSRVRKYRPRMESPGLMLQMDGSPHRWFGEEKSCLIAMVDDATSDIHAEFFPSETTEGCMRVMKAYIEKRGIFKTLYVDRAGFLAALNAVIFRKCSVPVKSSVLKLSLLTLHREKDELNVPSIPFKTVLFPNSGSMALQIWTLRIVTYKGRLFLTIGIKISRFNPKRLALPSNHYLQS
ncbi:hypothetical protein TUM4438_44470 [Shewanella sairae]|uniref:ISNCY family transposase n=1 Tax=Shewanella sairae TaxID=190310 RepID=A0ABQ4PRR8_9GAMM|nr:hypothetical protein TUM4438_44470 [Shewanella sairae]